MPEKQEHYLEWLLTPEPDRVPATEQEWCLNNGVAQGTVKKWRRDKRFREKWSTYAAENVVAPDRLQRITDTLAKAGAHGDVNAAKAYMAYVEKLAPPREVQRDAQLMAMTNAELVAAVEAALDGFEL